MASRTSTPLVHPPTRELSFTGVMSALSDPVRLGIVAAIARHPRTACGRFVLPVGKAAASRHFRVLRESGILRQWDEGTRRLNELRHEELDARFPGLLTLAIAEGAQTQIVVLAPTGHPLPTTPPPRTDLAATEI